MREGSSFRLASPLEVSWLQRHMHTNAGTGHRRQYSHIQRDQGSAVEAARLLRSRSAGTGDGRFSKTAASGKLYTDSPRPNAQGAIGRGDGFLPRRTSEYDADRGN